MCRGVELEGSPCQGDFELENFPHDVDYDAAAAVSLMKKFQQLAIEIHSVPQISSLLVLALRKSLVSCVYLFIIKGKRDKTIKDELQRMEYHHSGKIN